MFKMSRFIQWWLLVLLLAVVWCKPNLYHEEHPFSVVSELNGLRTSHPPRLQGQDPRLPLPSPQDLEAIKKVAQILVMLGEQVIPAIIGEPQTGIHAPVNVVDVPNDPVMISS